eukprot:343119-Prymnesium_polylepis.1
MLVRGGLDLNGLTSAFFKAIEASDKCETNKDARRVYEMPQAAFYTRRLMDTRSMYYKGAGRAWDRCVGLVRGR